MGKGMDQRMWGTGIVSAGDHLKIVCGDKVVTYSSCDMTTCVKSLQHRLPAPQYSFLGDIGVFVCSWVQHIGAKKIKEASSLNWYCSPLEAEIKRRQRSVRLKCDYRQHADITKSFDRRVVGDLWHQLALKHSACFSPSFYHPHRWNRGVTCESVVWKRLKRIFSIYLNSMAKNSFFLRCTYTHFVYYWTLQGENLLHSSFKAVIKMLENSFLLEMNALFLL